MAIKEIKRSWSWDYIGITIVTHIIFAFMTVSLGYWFSMKPIQEDRTRLEKEKSTLEKKLLAAKEKISALYQHIDGKDQTLADLNGILAGIDLTAAKKKIDSLNQSIEKKMKRQLNWIEKSRN